MGDTAEGSREGSQFGRYQLGRLLGRGGMGEVYEAWDTVKEWPVALKLMSPAYSQDPVFRKRLQREARTAGRLQEPHVVPTDSTNGSHPEAVALGWPWNLSGSWLAGWMRDIGLFVGCCLGCWAFDFVGNRLRPRADSGGSVGWRTPTSAKR